MKYSWNDNLYIVSIEDTQVGSITFSKLHENVYSIDSVFVNPAYRGRGIAKDLVDTFVAHAKDNGYKIKPLCSYAVKVFLDTPSYSDIEYIE